MPEIEAQRIAFTAIVYEKGYKIGLCHEGIDGYTPTLFGPYSTYESYNKMADTLNSGLGLTKEDAYKIIASTMRRKPEKYIIGRIHINDTSILDDSEEKILRILDDANITYELNDTNDNNDIYIDINHPLEDGQKITAVIFIKIQEILKNNKREYIMTIREYTETREVYEGSSE
jgi:hypothetical protein